MQGMDKSRDEKKKNPNKPTLMMFQAHVYAIYMNRDPQSNPTHPVK
jgi:hypothetical protein